MADKNYSIDDILNEYSGKIGKQPEDKKDDDIDIDTLLAGIGKTASQKTEMIEDVLEVGDNSFAFDPGDITPEEEETDPLKIEHEKSSWSDVKLEFGSHTPEKEAPAADNDSVEEIPIPELREGKKTTTGTKALDEVLSKKQPAPTVRPMSEPKPAKEVKEPAPEKAAEEKPQPKKPMKRVTPQPDDEIKPIREVGSNTDIIEGLMKLKKERGAPKAESKVPPVNRASIDDIDLEIGKKVLPNTEVGLDENATEAEKLAYLNAKRRERVKEFVVETEQEAPSKDDVADFTSFEQARDMSKSIISLKKSLVVRLCILIVTAVVSVYITMANDLGLPLISWLSRAEGMGTAYTFAQVVLGLIACFVSYTVLIVGFKKLVTLKPDSDSIASVSVLFSIVTGIVMLSDTEMVQRQSVHIFIPAAVIGLLVNTVGKLLIVSRTERNFRYVAGGYSKYAVMHIDDENVAGKFTKGALSDFPSLSTSRKTEFVMDFIKNSYSADLTDSFCKIFVPVVTLISVAMGALAYFVHPEALVENMDILFHALSVATGVMVMMSCVGMMLVTNIPLANASKKYLQNGGVMLGYSAVEKFCDTNSLLIDAVDLFPDGMVDIINLKPTKKCSLEEGILYAGSLCCQTESILRSAFYKMIKGKTEMLYPVESYIYEDGLGLSGWIQNKRVLFGNRQLMESHSIEGIPTVEKEAQYAKGDNSILYLSIGGNLAMLFVIQIRASVEVANALKDLEKNKITVIIRSVDSLLSLSRLTELFGVSPNMFKLLPFRYHADYDQATSYVAKMSSPMIYSGRFASLGMLLCGTKRLAKSAMLGVIIQVLSAVLGFVLSLVLLLTGAFTTLTGTVACVYCIIWAVVTAIVQNLQKS